MKPDKVKEQIVQEEEKESSHKLLSDKKKLKSN
jgi:Uri superfamily endonuclease